MDEEKKKSLRLSLIDGFLYSLMVGAGESYFVAYALSTGIGEVDAGILSTLPLVIGSIFQLISLKGIAHLQSHKTWVVLAVMLQAFTFLPLILLANYGHPGFWTLLLIFSVYWGASFAAGPAWNYWMGLLVSEKHSHSYFARRAQLSQIGILIGIVFGGMALHYQKQLENPFSIHIFTFIFLFAFVCRFLSAMILNSKLYLKDWSKEMHNASLMHSIKTFIQNNERGEFFKYLIPFQVVLFLTSPYVTPYLLAQKNFEYGDYMITIAALFVGKIVSTLWVQFKKNKYDGLQVFAFGALSVSPLPAFWSIIDSTMASYLLQFISGLGWGFFEIGLALIFYKDLSQKEKVNILTIYNFMNSVSMIIGGYFGAKILWYFDKTISSYHFLFILGSVLRVLIVIPLLLHVYKWRQKRMHPPVWRSTEKVTL